MSEAALANVGRDGRWAASFRHSGRIMALFDSRLPLRRGERDPRAGPVRNPRQGVATAGER